MTAFPSHETTSTRAGRRPSHTERRPSARLISEGVVASYIHEISGRHSDGVRAHSPRRDIAASADVLIAERRQRDHVYRAR